MFKTIHFPIKGTFYYAAELAIENDLLPTNTPLMFKAEPDNSYDVNAIQIWRPTQSALNPHGGKSSNESDEKNSGLLLGYVPRQLAPILTPYLTSHYPLNPYVIRKAKKGKLIEIDCAVQLHLSWQQSLKVSLIHFWLIQQQFFKKLRSFLSTK